MNLFVKENIDLKELCKGWLEYPDRYEINSPFDEFCIIYKEYRIIYQDGYNNMINEWYIRGIIETKSKEDNRICFI